MAKPAAKRVKVEKGAVSEPAPTEAPAAAPVKEEKKPARPKTAAEVAHEAEMKARSDPYKGRALFGRQLDISTKNGVLGGSGLGTYCTINADQYPRRGGQEIICCSYTFGAGLPTAAGLDGTAGFREDGGTRPLFVRRGGYPAELRNERYGPYNGTAPGAAAGKRTNGWEYCGDYRVEQDDMVDGISLSSMPEVEQQHWLVARGVQIKTSARRRREVTCTQDHWARTGRSHLVDDYKNDPESVLVASDRLVFVSYDEQLYKDLKAHQDARVAEM